MTFTAGDRLYISAQNNDDAGGIICTIKEGEATLARNISYGAYVISTCQTVVH